MKRKMLRLGILAALIMIILAACKPTVPSTPTTEVPLTQTPRPTATALPPKPVVPYTPVPAEMLSPIVVYRSPQRGESIQLDDAIEIAFDKPMDQKAVAKAFQVQLAGETKAVPGEFIWKDTRTLFFKPTQSLARDSVYDVVLTQDAVSTGGESLRQPFTFRFSTVGYLEVAQVMPAPDTQDVETNAVITVIFNRPVVPLTSLQLMEDLPHPLVFAPAVKGHGEWLNTSIYIFTPDEALAGGITYRVSVLAGLQDTAGSLLADDYTWHFTTAPPEVVWHTPGQDASLVDIRAPIRVEFNQPVDPDSVKRAFSLTSGGLLNTKVGGEFTVEGSSVTFQPARDLAFDTLYQVSIDAGVTSMAGGIGMTENYVWEFTTVPLPRIVATYPEDRERNASPYTDFSITFNAPINPATVMPNIQMTPPLSPTQVYTYYSSYNNTFSFYFGPKPSSEYEVRITAGIADPYGNTIPIGQVVQFRTAPLDPNYRLYVPEVVGTYDAALPAQLVVGHININRLNLRLYRMPEQTLERSYWEWREELPQGAELLRTWQETLESPLDDQAFTVVNLTAAVDELLTPGVYYLEVDAPELRGDDYRTHQQHVMVVSDINLTLKVGPEEGLVWATRLDTGEPVPNLNLNVLELYGGFTTEITTDRQGVARFSVPEYHNTLLVTSASPFAAVSDTWSRGISPWDFNVSEGVYGQDFRTYITTDRPIYRPGQEVNFKGIIRAEDDAVFAPSGIRKVMVTIRDAAYEEFYNQELTVNSMGSFEGKLVLEEGASLGQYLIMINVADNYADTAFQVAAYRPPEFEVVVEVDEAEVQRGDNINATISAAYFFGGGLGDTVVRWNVTAERYSFTPPWGGRYSFDDVDDPYICYRCWWWWWPESVDTSPILEGTGTTDENGLLSLTLDGRAIAEALQKGARRITLEAVVSGPDNQQIAGRTALVVHPGAFYTGLSPRQYVSDAGEESDIDIVVVDWAGQRLPDQQIKVSFYHFTWENTFVENETGGGRWEWETKETLVEEVVVSSDVLGEAVATFVPPKGGSYHVVAQPANLTPQTEAIRSSIFIWAAGDDQVSWRRENHDRITLVSDKTTYKVGDIAEILIPSPFTGPHMALITVEREGIRRHEVIRIANNSTIYRLLIEEGDIPNVYVSVVLVKERTNTDPASYKMGLLPLDVDLAPKTLHVEVVPSVERAEPGQEVVYTLIATGPDGQPATGAELSLDIVDKAVLSLKPRTATILDTLYARRALQVGTSSGLTLSINRYMEEIAEDLALDVVAQDARGMGDEMEEMASFELDGAADMPMAAPAEGVSKSAIGENIAPPAGVDIREEFADTAFWAPQLLTDAQGKVSVSVTLPDNLTAWVARGVGITSDTIVGEGTSDLIATKPLLVRPVAPRFFVVDDRAQLAANVSNNTARTLVVDVSLSAKGVGIYTETPPLQSITIPANSERKVTWWVTVEDVVQAELVFSAVSGTYADASKPRLTTGPDGSLKVLRYTAPDIVGTAGQIIEGGSRTEAIALPPNLDDRRGQVTVHLDPSLAASMREGLDYLEHYEYECTEQTVSRFLPNLLTYNALQSLGIKDSELEARLPGLIKTGIDKLTMQQNPDGGWGWWHNIRNPYSNPYVSGYVVFGLLKAQQMNISVDRSVVSDGIAYINAQLVSERTFKGVYDANLQAWLLYVLAEGDAAPKDKLDTLYENREKLSHYARAYLAQALWLEDRNDSRLATLLSDLNNTSILSATGAHWEERSYDWWAMNTDTRSTAIILDTLAKLDPENALIPNIVRWLMVARQAGIWETTQETAWALISLTDWMVVTGELDANYDFALFLNEKERVSGSVTPDTVQDGVTEVIAITDLLRDATNTLSIARSDGNGRLYYSAHLEVYLPVEEIEPADRGFMVQRRYTLANCEEDNRLNCPEVNEIKLGDVVRVDITLITPHDRYYVVLEDPLPAGAEAVDTGLATTSLLAMSPGLHQEESRWWWWWNWYSRSELRDEKVVLFADYLSAGTYEYSYTFRATLPGDYHVIPALAKEFYFPEVFGRSDGRLLTIGE